jgi:DNA polymerase-3 subunit delta'
MKWTDIIGHGEQIKVLRHMQDCDRMPHAMLLAGPSGIGKRMVASMLATTLLCSGAKSGPCGTCQSCQQVNYGTHPDLLVVCPDGANIKIEQIRNLQHEVAMTPYVSARRVCIIDGAELMRVEAANSLLKVLEEPVGDVVFILVAANKQMLLQTIISRCMTIDFQPLIHNILSQALTDKGFSSMQSEVAAKLSRGRMGTALTMLEPDGFAVRDQAAQILESLFQGGMKSVWDTAATLEKIERKELLQLIGYFTYLLRDFLMIVTRQEQDVLFNIDLAQWLSEQSDRWSEEGLLQALKVVENARRALNANANARLTSEALLIKIYDLAKEV